MIVDRICTSLQWKPSPVSKSEKTIKKVSQSALPAIGSIGALLLAVLPIPGNTILLAGVVLAAAHYCEPEPAEPVTLPKLSSLFSPAMQLKMNIHFPNGDALPEDAPRGIKDEGGSGWLNADLQLIESSGALMQWIKELPPPQELNAFCEFYHAYHGGGEKLSSAAIRSSMSSIFPIDKTGADPFDLLALILDHCPPELKGNVRKTVYYNTPIQGALHDLEIKDAEIPIISLQIRGANPHLERMLHAFYNERPIGLKRAEVDEHGKTHIYRANRIERRFITTPTELWFHIARFENVVQKSIFHNVPFLKSIFPPIEMGVAKSNAPVWIPQEIEVNPLLGPSRMYRLNGFVVHEGASPQENRVKAYRFKDNILYGCHNEWVVKISPLVQQEILSQAYLLHYEPV